MAQSQIWSCHFLASMKFWAPPPSWLTLVDQERGGDFFCPPFKDQPVETAAEIYVRSTVKKHSNKFWNFWKKETSVIDTFVPLKQIES